MKENINELFEWCAKSLSFLKDVGLDQSIVDDMTEVLDQLKNSENLKALKSIKKEIETEFISELEAKDRKRLEDDLGQLKKDPAGINIHKILSRGKIISDEEYVFLEQSVTGLEGKYLSKANSMLVKYYDQKG